MCLRSLANQMAKADRSILRRLLEMHLKNPISWDTWDDKTLWQKVFLGCIFKGPNIQPRFWVIDAMDECQKSQSLLGLLTTAPSWLRIFCTSRNSLVNERNSESMAGMSKHYQLQHEDTYGDLKIFINYRLAIVSACNDIGSEDLKQRILEKSSGSFMWVSLVTQKLQEAYSDEEASEILGEVPTDMNDIYSEMVGVVVQNRRSIRLARSLFVWTLLSIRPLGLDGLQHALKLDTSQTVNNLSKLVPAISGRFVFVNRNDEPEVIHETAKCYLLQQETHPELKICKPECHTRIAKICLSLLVGDSTKGQSSQSMRKSVGLSAMSAMPNITEYACEYFSDHLQKSLSQDDENWGLLFRFLTCNLLSWIELLAKKRHLRTITRAAQNLQAYLRRRIKYLSPISPQRTTIEACIYDMFRLSAKFGEALITSPMSIHHLIPSMCPSESTISRYLSATPGDNGFSIKGIKDETWDDCLVRIDYPNQQTSAIACGEQYSAIALWNGSINLYFQNLVQPQFTLNHDGRANVLLFSGEDRYLISSGQRKVRVWNPSEGVLLWSFNTSHQVLALFFMDNEKVLVGATQGNYLVNWDLDEGRESTRWRWTDSIHDTTGKIMKTQLPQPGKAAFSSKSPFLAVNYRGMPLHLFDIYNQKFLGHLHRDYESELRRTTSHYLVEALAFNPSQEIDTLITSYGDGELVVYDISSRQLIYRLSDVFAHCLKCSPDGRTLVTGSARGTLQVFEFAGTRGERVLPLYTINADDDGIRDVTFTSDSLRFADIRSSQYRVWEPAILARNDVDEGSQSELSHPVSVEVKSVGMLEGSLDPEITTMCSHPSGSFVFCGKKDGSVCFFDTRTATQRRILYSHAANIGVTCITFVEKENLLITGDESGRVLINKLAVSDTGFDFLGFLFEIRSEQSLLTLSHDLPGTYILLRGKKSTEIWNTKGEKVKNIMDDDPEAQFVNHPSHPDFFVSMSRNGLQNLYWANNNNGTTLEGKKEVDVMITPPTPTVQELFTDKPPAYYDLPGGPPFLAGFFNQAAKTNPQYSKSLGIWSVSSLENSQSPISLGNFSRQIHRVRQIISVANTVLFFLDTDLWICSLDLSSSSTIMGGARRHFFLLSEWQSIYGGFLIDYLPLTRQFVVSKKHDILVISGGLEFEEPWRPKSELC